MNVELHGPRLVVGEPSYPTMNSQTSIPFVACVWTSFASVRVRLMSRVLSSRIRLSVEAVSFISPWPYLSFVSLASPSEWLEGSKGFLVWCAWLVSCITLIGTGLLLSASYPKHAHPLYVSTGPPLRHYDCCRYNLSHGPKTIALSFFSIGAVDAVGRVLMFGATSVRRGMLDSSHTDFSLQVIQFALPIGFRNVLGPIYDAISST